MYDLVIRNGCVIDGTGAARREGCDVAVEGQRIVAVGPDLDPGAEEIDATGHLVLPGFVDIHTHYDGQITWDPDMAPSSQHGVTTVVMGNCGVGFAPAAPDRHDWLIGLMEGVEDIPAEVLSAAIDWRWESVEEYLDALQGLERTLDFVVQVSHGAVRGYVMGDRGARNELATDEEIAAMADIVERSIRAGALGFSTSRTRVHRASDGECVPGTFASHAEVMAIANAMARGGFGVFEISSAAASAGDLHGEFADDVDLMTRVAIETGLPVSYLLNQSDTFPDQWREVLDTFAAVNADKGTRIIAQTAARPPGVIMGLLTSMHPFKEHPTFKRLDHLPLEQLVAELRKPEVKAQILSEETEYYADSWFHMKVAKAMDQVYELGDPPDYEPAPEDSIARRAEAAGRDPHEYCYEALLERDGRAMLFMAVSDYAAGNLDTIYERLQDENCILSLSDSGAHVRAICDSSSTTSLLTHWARDRRRGPTLPLELLVKRQTSETAALYELHDRGVVAPGYRADLNVIDFDGLRLYEPHVEFDLPTGAGRLLQKVDGYKATVVAGQVTLADGELTGARPGRLVRGPQAGPVGKDRR